MGNNIAILVENISVAYRPKAQRQESLRDSLLSLSKTFQAPSPPTITALNNISFEVIKGSCLGIIGDNGAGKTTLLRVLAGVLPPTTGTVFSTGSIDCVMQLGAGFDLELNAIENILLYLTLRRKSLREAKKRIEPIIDFAELREFASTPIKYYSSGMRARLGFAAAIDSTPDILIIDEVFTVGDDRFKGKCIARFSELTANGTTLIMVNHGMPTIKNICSDVVVLSEGSIEYRGAPTDAIDVYRKKRA